MHQMRRLKLSWSFVSSHNVQDWLHRTGCVALTTSGLHSLLWGAAFPVTLVLVTLVFKLHEPCCLPIVREACTKLLGQNSALAAGFG